MNNENNGMNIFTKPIDNGNSNMNPGSKNNIVNQNSMNQQVQQPINQNSQTKANSLNQQGSQNNIVNQNLMNQQVQQPINQNSQTEANSLNQQGSQNNIVNQNLMNQQVQQPINQNSQIEANSLNQQESQNKSFDKMSTNELLKPESRQYNEELIKAYIGDKYEKILNSKISIPSLFFGEFYLFYRKMYLYGLICMIIKIVLAFTPISMASILINIGLMFMTNKIYINFTKNKVNKISSQNYNKSNDDLILICSKKGGTSISMTIGSIFIEIILIIISLLIALLVGLTSMFNNLFDNITNESTEFSGLLFYDTDVIISDNFSITVPTVFSGDSDSEDSYDYEYESNPNAIFGECKVSLGAVEGYKSSKNLIEQMNKYYNSDTTATEKSINGIKWYYFNSSNSMNSYEEYYATEKNNKVYLYQYTIGSNANLNTCKTYSNDIINSINSK